MEMLEWLGIFDDVKIIISGNISSADILLNLLLQKWEMAPEDKDMVVMQHEVEYLHRGDKIKMTSTMVIEGESRDHSAMAKTVGLPMAILAKMVLTNKIVPPKGVLIPSMPSVYRPVLNRTETPWHRVYRNGFLIKKDPRSSQYIVYSRYYNKLV